MRTYELIKKKRDGVELSRDEIAYMIKGFVKSTLIDWEGKLAAVVFLGGCNFRCPYCHASELVLNPEKLPDIPVEEVVAYLQEKKDWIVINEKEFGPFDSCTIKSAEHGFLILASEQEKINLYSWEYSNN